jgi:predicted nuclease of predicted toxin-antitoxin system
MALRGDGTAAEPLMSMKILVDMNLSPSWVEFLSDHGIPAVHWSNIGERNADDDVIMAWARDNDHVVFTHDLDFGKVLALTRLVGPSVLQVRAQDVLPKAIGSLVLAALRDCEDMLRDGALVVVDESKRRARVLPLQL